MVFGANRQDQLRRGVEEREAARLSVHAHGIMSLTVAGSEPSPVTEVSRTALGASLRVPRGGFERTAGILPGSLWVLGQANACALRLVRSNYVGATPFAAFAVLEQRPAGLAALADLVELLACGQALGSADASGAHLNWGSRDGRSTLSAQLGGSGVVKLELTWRNRGKAQTLSFNTDAATGPVLASAGGVSDLRDGLVVLAGLAQAGEERFAGVFAAGMKTLGLPTYVKPTMNAGTAA